MYKVRLTYSVEYTFDEETGYIDKYDNIIRDPKLMLNIDLDCIKDIGIREFLSVIDESGIKLIGHSLEKIPEENDY